MNNPSSSSPLSDRNKLSISVDIGSGANNRWSKVVPQNPALTFAAVWDPENGMMTFSGAHLLECESSSGAITRPPNVLFDDDVSDSVTVEHTSESEESSATTGTSQSAFKAFLHRVPRDSKSHKRYRKCSGTLGAPSAFGGLDVYSRDPVTPATTRPRVKHQCSFQRFAKPDEEFPLKAQAAFSDISSESDHVSDEGFFEDVSSVGNGRTELKSHWFATTTSTSAYVKVPRMSDKASETQSRIPHPLWIADKDQPVSNLTTPLKTPRRRLKKRRPDGFSSPSDSSSGSSPTSSVSLSSISSPISPSGSFHSRRSRRLTRVPKDDSWVCIEMTPFITEPVVDETSTI